MKNQWVAQELLDHWTLTPQEITLIRSVSQTAYNQFGYGLLFKLFQREGKFPQRKQDIPTVIVEHLGRQLQVPEEALTFYSWTGRTAKRHRVHIRKRLGFGISTLAEAQQVSLWLSSHTLAGDERNMERLREVVYGRFRDLKLEPPEPKSIDRLIRSGLRTADDHFYRDTAAKLSPETLARLDALLDPALLVDGTAGQASVLQSLRSEPGPTGLESVLAELAKLRLIRSLGLPSDLFSHVSPKVVSWYRARVAVEDVREIRRHPDAIRSTLLAAYCVQRQEEIIDTLIELLISIIHRIEKRAERTVDKQVLREVKRIRGKHRLLYEVAQASIRSPEGTVKEVIYPVAPEQTLRALVEEFRLGGSYEQKVQVLMRGSYSNHYRRMVPLILKELDFRATGTAPKPLLAALDLIRKYAAQNIAFYPETEDIPLQGVVPESWLSLVKQGQRVNRISYELCALKGAREKIRCKEIYAVGANRYRNPEEDLPQDFAEKRTDYYTELGLPLSASQFIAQQKREMEQELATFNRTLPKNRDVAITTKKGKPWITVAKLEPQKEPRLLTALKAEVGRRWGQLFLLDVLKEAALRTDFLSLFKSPALYETLPRDILQMRLILCLYAIGTNIGLKRVVSGIAEKYSDLLYVKSRVCPTRSTWT
jgi:Domain of unknown function (DUF4158)/Tn3 transposase DDE domain